MIPDTPTHVRLTKLAKGFFALINLLLALLAIEGLVRLVDLQLDLAEHVREPLPFPPPPPASVPMTAESTDTIHWRPNQALPATSFPSNVNLELITLRPEDLPAEDQKIFLVGASAARGDGVRQDQTFAALLEGRLAGVRVFNVSENGLSAALIRARLHTLVDRYQPAAIIVLAGNEWLHFHWAEESTIWQQARKIMSHSYCYLYLTHLGRQTAIWYWRGRPFDPNRGCCWPQEAPASQWPNWLKTREKRLQGFESNLAESVGYARQRGVPVILCDVPFRHHLCPAYFIAQPAEPLLYYRQAQAAVKKEKSSEATQYFRQARETMVGNLGAVLSINQIIHRVAQQEGVSLVALQQALEQAAGDPLAADHFFLDSCHLNAAGHQAAAEAILPALQTLLSAPPP